MAKPLCKYFGECGGCSSQHIDYDLQIENKKKSFINSINFNDVKVFSGKEYYYRNRMDFIFHKNGLGFRKKGQWQNIINIDECVISDEKINALLKEIKDFFKDIDYFDIKKHSGTFRYAVIRISKNDSSISFVLNQDSKKLKEARELIEKYSKISKANNIMIANVPSNTDLSISEESFVIKGRSNLNENYLGKDFAYPIQGFFQNNNELAEKMHYYVNDLLKNYDTKNSFLLDLYGGVGTFGIINSYLFKKVLIVENSKESIECAKNNIENNEIKNAEAIVLDAKYLKKIELPEDLIVITDPPRSGMNPRTIEQLNKLSPKAIIYVSCNVQQLGKDLLKFKDYKIKNAALFDLFPQTYHSEAIVELTKD